MISPELKQSVDRVMSSADDGILTIEQLRAKRRSGAGRRIAKLVDMTISWAKTGGFSENNAEKRLLANAVGAPTYEADGSKSDGLLSSVSFGNVLLAGENAKERVIGSCSFESNGFGALKTGYFNDDGAFVGVLGMSYQGRDEPSEDYTTSMDHMLVVATDGSVRCIDVSKDVRGDTGEPSTYTLINGVDTKGRAFDSDFTYPNVRPELYAEFPSAEALIVYDLIERVRYYQTGINSILRQPGQESLALAQFLSSAVVI
ncbi:hypothetical protein KA021_01535 [Candidatus Saccharibacteria bacterium]|jgi:hypothetical protein|nr:hypothetical protein [Candidatus Saccharibacteria bacterium]